MTDSGKLAESGRGSPQGSVEFSVDYRDSPRCVKSVDEPRLPADLGATEEVGSSLNRAGYKPTKGSGGSLDVRSQTAVENVVGDGDGSCDLGRTQDVTTALKRIGDDRKEEQQQHDNHDCCVRASAHTGAKTTLLLIRLPLNHGFCPICG